MFTVFKYVIFTFIVILIAIIYGYKEGAIVKSYKIIKDLKLGGEIVYNANDGSFKIKNKGST